MKCKNCSCCNQTKLESEFYQYTNGRIFAKCKTCTREDNRQWRNENKEKVSKSVKKWHKTISGYRHKMWNTVSHRCGSDGSYKNIELKMTKEEFYDFITPLIEKFLDQYPDETPSLDRIDPKGHYEKNNIQIIEWKKNLTKSSVFLQRMGVNKKSPHSEKIKALSQIVIGQCEVLDLNPSDMIKELSKWIDQ